MCSFFPDAKKPQENMGQGWITLTVRVPSSGHIHNDSNFKSDNPIPLVFSKILNIYQKLKHNAMNLEKAKQLFEEIVDLCYQTENQQLIESINNIYPEVEDAQDLSRIISSAEELQINMSEMEFLPEEEDDIQEMNEKIEKLSE